MEKPPYQVMTIRAFLVASILLSCLAAICYGVSFATLEKTLLVEAVTKRGKELKAGEDEITLKWSFNTSFETGRDSSYKKIKLKLCYAPISQQDRAWRKTVDDLKKDKTCQFDIVEQPYKAINNNYTWTVERDVPTATYFIRAYAYNSEGDEVGYGQNTDDLKAANKLFEIQAISGRHATLDICSICFSAFSIVALFGFFFMEKRQSKRAAL